MGDAPEVSIYCTYIPDLKNRPNVYNKTKKVASLLYVDTCFMHDVEAGAYKPKKSAPLRYFETCFSRVKNTILCTEPCVKISPPYSVILCTI